MHSSSLPPRWHLLLLGGGGISLILGIMGGLWRLGWNIPLPGTEPATFHGALMAAAFFGTVIGVERALAYGSRSAYFGPLCTSVGGCATAIGAPHLFSSALLVMGSVVIAAVSYAVYRRRPAPQLLVLLVGACCGVGGNLLWAAGLPTSQIVGAWIGFLVLTISGERLLHSHLHAPTPTALKLLTGLAGLFIAAAIALPSHWPTGTLLLGPTLTAFALWLAVYDVARRNLRHHGSMRFGAVCLMAGYFWLAVGGLLLPFAAPAGPIYDAALHAVFLGFVVSLAMGHTLTVFPAGLGITMPYTPLHYGHLALLNAALLLRIAGDLAQKDDWRAWGGLGNALAILLFLVVMARGAIRNRQQEVT